MPDSGSQLSDPAAFFAGHPTSLAVFERVRAVLEEHGGAEVRTSKSQVAFRRRRGFASVWLPGQYLAHPRAEVVLSIALGREVSSPRFKAVANPSRTQWMHHLEIHDVADVDAEVADWLREAAARAG